MDGQEDNGLSLQGLAQRLEALERENAELRQEVAALRGSEGTHPHEELAELRGSEAPGVAVEPASESDGRVSRKRLLSRAGAAAAGLLVAGALTQRDIREAKAAIVSGTTNTAYRGAVEGTNESPSGYGVWGNSGWTGVYGSGALYGVRGWSQAAIGVYGQGNTGVYGQTSSDNRAGVYGYHSASGFGVVGEGGAGYAGVKGHTRDGTGYGVHGVGRPGVRGDSSTSGGTGVEGSGGTSGGDGVYGVAYASTSAGVYGINKQGYGGTFFGGKAQLKLEAPPTRIIGRPTTGAHSFGELYLDPRGSLFVCTASGSPGKWRKFTTTAA